MFNISLTTLCASIQQFLFCSEKKESFISIMNTWLTMRKKEAAPATYEQNKYYCKHYIAPYFKDYMINKIDTQDVLNYMNQSFCLLFTTGMRSGEVCGLRWCDLHEDHVIPSIVIDKRRGTSYLKNEFAPQSVYLNSKLLLELKKHTKRAMLKKWH